MGDWKGEMVKEQLTKQELAVMEKLFSDPILLSFQKDSEVSMSMFGQVSKGTFTTQEDLISLKLPNKELQLQYKDDKLYLDEYEMMILFTKE